MNIVEKASDNTIGRTLKKTLSNRPAIGMEITRRDRRFTGSTCRTYAKAAYPERPLVCLDETSKLGHRDAQAGPAKLGQPIRFDYEYERNGVANIFMTFAPLEGWRKVKVTDQHAAVDYAQVLKELSDVHLPDAKQIVLVQDNLSTHTAASLYAAFPPEEARRLAKRFGGVIAKH